MKRRSFLKGLAAAAAAVMAPLAISDFGNPPELGPNEFKVGKASGLLAYQMPITKIIEDNSVKDFQEIEDRAFLRELEKHFQP